MLNQRQVNHLPKDIKILVATQRPYWMPADPVYLPIQVGAEGKAPIGYTTDDTGNHISAKNPHFCELTAIYWAWKNLEADYIGLCHYRRYFTRKEVHNLEEKKEMVLTGSEWEHLLSGHSVVVADKRKYYIESNYSHYIHAHPKEGLILAGQVIHELYPEYDEAFYLVMKRTWAHMFNMFVMRRDRYHQYCEWLFAVLFEVEKRLDISGYDPYNSRVFGFIGERLLDVWLEKQQIPYKEQNVSFLEKQNWLKKGSLFLLRKMKL